MLRNAIKNLEAFHFCVVQVFMVGIFGQVVKSDNLQYNTLGRWDNRLIDHVPSIIFFPNFLQYALQKSLQLFFFLLYYNIKTIKINSFESKPATHCFIFKLS